MAGVDKCRQMESTLKTLDSSIEKAMRPSLESLRVISGHTKGKKRPVGEESMSYSDINVLLGYMVPVRCISAHKRPHRPTMGAYVLYVPYLIK